MFERCLDKIFLDQKLIRNAGTREKAHRSFYFDNFLVEIIESCLIWWCSCAMGMKVLITDADMSANMTRC